MNEVCIRTIIVDVLWIAATATANYSARISFAFVCSSCGSNLHVLFKATPSCHWPQQLAHPQRSSHRASGRISNTSCRKPTIASAPNNTDALSNSPSEHACHHLVALCKSFGPAWAFASFSSPRQVFCSEKLDRLIAMPSGERFVK